jgi:hypothetical protein
MFKSRLASLFAKLYSSSHKEEVISAGVVQPIFPPAVKQRSLHHWDWATNAPQKGMSNDQRTTAIVQTCKLCGATSSFDHRTPHLRYLHGWSPAGTLQPFCPPTCQDTIELMNSSPMSLEERRRYFDIWNHALRVATPYQYHEQKRIFQQ